MLDASSPIVIFLESTNTDGVMLLMFLLDIPQ